MSGNTLTTGTLTAKTVTVTGNEKVMPSIGGIAATSVEATYATIAGNVSTAGTQSYNNVVFAEVENVAPNLTSTVAELENVDAAIVITDSTGSLGTIKAEAFAANEESNIISILIGNSSVKANLAIEALDASTDEEIDTYGDIAITGTVKYPVSVGSVKANDLTANFATFSGAIEAVDIVSTSSTFNGAIEAADIVSTSSTFTGAVNAVTVTDGVSGSGSTFSGDVNTTGTQSYNGSVFVDEPKLTSTATELEEGSEAAIVITNSTGKVGSIKTEAFTYSDNGFYSIIINNSEASASLTTGMLSAYTSTTSNENNNNVDVDSNIYGDISVTGKSSSIVDVVVTGLTGNNITVKYAQLEGRVFAKSKLTSTYSLYKGATVRASELYDGDENDAKSGSAFDSSHFITEYVCVYYTSFNNLSNIVSSGSVQMTTVKGTAGDIVSEGSNITIINGNADSSFSVNYLRSYYGDVIIVGNSKYQPVINDVNAGSVDARYAKVTGYVSTSGSQSYINSSFAKSSRLESSATVKMKTVAGEISTVSVYTNSSITIDNTNSDADFETGTLYSYGNITVTGNTSFKTTITGVERAVNLKAEYASVVGQVITSGTQVYTNVEFAEAYENADAPKLSTSIADSALTEDDKAAIYISMSTGTVGNITAADSSILVNTEGIKDDFATGKLTALTVEVVGNADYMPSIGGVDSEDKFESSYVEITDDVSTTGIQTYTNVVFTDTPNLVSTVTTIGYYDEAAIYISESIGDIGDITVNHSIKIETSEKFDENLTTGVLSAQTVTVIGKSKSKPAIGGVKDTTDFVVTDFVVTDAIIAGDVETAGTQVYTNVEFVNDPALTTSIQEVYRDKATKAAIYIDNSIGTVGDITAEESSILIDASKINTLLSTGTLTAKTVTINGNPEVMPSIGGLSGLINFVVSDVTIAGNVVTTGIQKYTNVEFINAPSLVSSATEIGIDDDAAIVIESSYGTVGNITASVTVDNTVIFAGDSSIKISANGIEKKLITGTLSAKTVTVVGNTGKMPTIGGVVCVDDFTVSDVIIAGEVSTKGLQKYTNVEFVKKDDLAPALKTTIDDSERIKAAGAAIYIDNSIGTVGNITTSDTSVLIDASQINTLLSTGFLKAKTVTINGNPDIMPNIGGVSGVTNFIVSDVTITGNVTTEGIQKYTNVEFENAPKLVSTADAKGIDDDAAIVIESSTGIVGDITATHSIKIDADGIGKNLITGKLSAPTVTVNGYAAKMPTIGGVECVDDFAVSNVIIAGNVETFGLQQYTNVVFKGAPDLNTTIADSEFTKAADAAIQIVNSIGTVGDITAEESSILVDASGVSEKLWIGTLSANKKVTVKGNPKIRPSIGDVEATEFVVNATDFVVNDAIIAGGVETTGTQIYTNVEFVKKDDHAPALTTTITDANLPRGVLEAIYIGNSTGTVGNITASYSSIKIDNSDANEVLATGILEAKTVTVTGNEKVMPSIGGVAATSVEATYATIAGDVSTTGTQSYNNVVFAEVENVAPNLTSTVAELENVDAAIVITDSTGTVGSVTAESSAITITDSRASGNTLTTGTLTAKTVTVTCNEKVMPTIGGVVCEDDFTISNVIIAGNVSTTGTQSYDNVVFAKVENVAPNLTSTVSELENVDAAIVITDSTGSLGSIKAEAFAANEESNIISILIDNSSVKANLAIEALDASTDEEIDTYGDVTITSASTKEITTTIGSIKGGNINLNDSLALDDSNSATLIVTNIRAYGALNVYGGKYGNTKDGIDFGSGSDYNKTINVYMGTFYVDDEPNFQKVAENLRKYEVNEYYGFVEILLNEDITLASEVQIGGWENSTDKYIGNKSVLIAGSDGKKTITIPYFSNDSYSKNYSLHFHSGIYELSNLDFVENKIVTEPDEEIDYYYYASNPVVSILIVFESNASLKEGTSISIENGILINTNN
ncbi:MAG: hypothetical protein IJ836_09110 [Spirochaetales bacterium]|nr:hypothetical protein [Spirochaetales bacterium]